MKKAKLQKVRDAIANAPPHKIAMQDWYSVATPSGFESILREDFNPSKCKTAACIKGWAWYVLGHNNDLGLTAEEEMALFHMHRASLTKEGFDRLPAKTRHKAALNVLDHFISNGEINWDLALKKAGVHL